MWTTTPGGWAKLCAFVPSALKAFCMVIILVLSGACASEEHARVVPIVVDETCPDSAFSHPRETIVEFLEAVTSPTEKEAGKDYADLCDGRIRKWEVVPTIKVEETATAEELETIRKVVERLNSALPFDMPVEIHEGDGLCITSVENVGKICIHLGLPDHWPEWEKERYVGISSFNLLFPEYFPDDVMRWGELWLKRREKVEAAQFEATVAHELLHIMGFVCHIKEDPWRYEHKCLMTHRVNWFDEMPSSLELDALKAVYFHLEPGSYPNELEIPANCQGDF